MTQPGLRGGVRDPRAGGQARHRPDGTAAPQRRPPRRRPAGARRPCRRRRVHRGRHHRSASTSSTRRCGSTTADATSATDWLVGAGTASSLHETAPPTDHISEAWATLRDDGMYEIAVGTVEFGEGTSTVHVQIAATNLGTTPSRIRLVQSDTDRTGFDTGAFASAGMFVAGNAVNYASTALRNRILGFAATHTGVDVADCAMDDDGDRVRRHPTLADRTPRGRPRPRHPVHRVAQGLRFAAQRHVEHPRLPHRRAPGHRRDPHPLQRARHRRRGDHQPRAGARSGRRRRRAWASASR